MAWRHDDSNASRMCVYTINTGGYEGDEILISSCKELPFDKLYFTDNIRLIYACVKEDVAPFYVSTVDKEPKLVQRTIKTSPHLYLPARYDRSIYMDGNLAFRNDSFSSNDVMIMNLCAMPIDIICFHHEVRDNLKAEGDAVLRGNLETRKNVEKIREMYRDCGFKDDIGLTETNVLIRRHRNIVEFSEDWTRCIEICRRDQISFDCLLYKHRANYKRLTFNEKAKMFKWVKHINARNRRLS